MGAGHARAGQIPPDHAISGPSPVSPASSSGASRLISHAPSVQDYPQSGVVGQPRRINEAQNHHIRTWHQRDWGRFNWGNGEAAGFGPVGMYGVAPWAEDWSYLRDPAQRRDIFDPLKFIALNKAGSLWLSLSGETRLRSWYEAEPGLGTLDRKNTGRFAVRNLYGADLHFGQHVRIFGQVVNGEAAGWRYYGYNTTWRRKLGVNQLFIEVKGRFKGARTGLIFGRQQFLDAPSWFLYGRDTPNVPITWNGGRLYAVWNSFRIDGYNFVATQLTHDHLFGGGFEDSTRLYGFNTSTALPLWKINLGILGHHDISSFLDVFWMGFRFGGASARIALPNSTQNGTQTRQNIGFRWYGSASAFEYDLSGVLQFGKFALSKPVLAKPAYEGGARVNNRSVQAYGLHFVTGWRHPESSFHPFIGFDAHYGSGNRDKVDGHVTGFVAPFSPQNSLLDSTLTLGRTNTAAIGPIVSISPRHFMSVRLRAPFFWRSRLNDGIYGSSGRYLPLTPQKLSGVGRFTGVIPQGSVQLQFNQHLKWQVDGGVVLISSSLKQAGARGGGYMLSTFFFRF